MMRLPRPRFTLRWLMTVVAIVAVSIAGYRLTQLRNLSREYREQSAKFAKQQASRRKSLESSERREPRTKGLLARYETQLERIEAKLSTAKTRHRESWVKDRE